MRLIDANKLKKDLEGVAPWNVICIINRQPTIVVNSEEDTHDVLPWEEGRELD